MALCTRAHRPWNPAQPTVAARTGPPMNQLASMTRHAPSQNALLAALPRADYERLSGSLELVPLPLGRAVYESGGQLDYVYFPTDCIVSLLSVTQGRLLGGDRDRRKRRAGRHRAVHGRGNHLEPRGGAERRLCLPGAGGADQAGVQSRRRASAPAAALHPGAHHADVADRGLQPASFARAAAVPLAAAERRPAAVEPAGDDRGADRQHARRAGRRGRGGGRHAAGRRPDPVPPRARSRCSTVRAGAARLRMLRGGQA